MLSLGIDTGDENRRVASDILYGNDENLLQGLQMSHTTLKCHF